MNQKDFFKQLKDELHGHPFRDRFLEELEDHAEDLEGEKLDTSQLKKRMGEPRGVKEGFLEIMNPFRHLFFAMEAVFFSMFFVPWSILSHVVLRQILLPGEGSPSALFVVGGLLGLLAIGFAIYTLAFRRFEELKSTVYNAFLGGCAVLLLPGLVTFIVLVASEEAYLMTKSGIFWMILAYLLLHLGAGAVSWGIKQSLKMKHKAKSQRKWSHYLKMVSLTYLIVSIVLRTIAVNTGLMWGMETSPLFEMLSPLFQFFGLLVSLELLSVSWWQLMVTSNVSEVNLLVTFWLPVALILFIGLQSLWVVIRQKKWVSFRSVVVFYVLSIFFIRGEAFVQEPTFKVPALNISRMIEKNEVGSFYPLLKYFNMAEGSLFHYQVGFFEGGRKGELEGDGFIIQTNTGLFSFIPYQGLNGDNFEIFYNFYELEAPTKTYLPESYVCDRSDFDHCNVSDFVNSSLMAEPVIVSDGAFSKDGRWGMVVIPNGAYNPEEVYLVKLKN